MKLSWRLFENPVYDSASPFFRGLSAFQITEAQFSTYAFGGFGEASLKLEDVPISLVEELWNNWLTKRITATDGAGMTAYEGYIAEIAIEQGSVNDFRTIDSFFNRAFVEYTYANGSCPAGSTCYGRAQRNETDVDSTADSQTRWGIKEEWLDLTGDGVITSTIANAAGDIALADAMRARNASWMLGDLQVRDAVTFMRTRPVNVQVTAWGYHTTLQWRKQSLRFKAATALETIISNVLTTGSKAPFIDTSATALANLVTTGRSIQYNTNAQPAWMSDYIADVISGGNSAGRRLTFQIWEDRVPFLSVRSTSPTYYFSANDERAFDQNHGVLPLYLVRAGGYGVREDAVENMTTESDVVNRPRAQFITETTYDAVKDTLTIPPPQVADETRLLARARRQVRQRRL